MKQHSTHRPSRIGLNRGVVALAALLAGLVAAAPPALAATDCIKASDDGSLIVRIDEADPADETLIQVRDGRLFVNGEQCDDGVGTSINIVDVGTPKVDRVKIDLGAGAFRMNGEAVFVNLILDDNGPNEARDRVRIRTTSGVDVVRLEPSIIIVDGPPSGTPLVAGPRQLLMGIGGPGANVKYYFSLRGGDDIFRMRADANGDRYSGFVSVKGGKGADDLVGGPGRQRLRGGKGADVIRGKGGADLLWGNSGADFITGGKGADVISGGRGVDDVRGGPGADILNMRDGRADDVRGQKGRDVCDCDASDNVSSARRL